MMYPSKSGKKSDPLNKKIPENPRYKHVQPTVDTGASVSKYMKHLEEIKKNYRYRSDEIFKRLKVTTFAQLVLQVTAEQYNSPPWEASVSVSDEESSPPDTHRSTLSSVISGIGELDVGRGRGATAPVASSLLHAEELNCPYLLLDVRDKEDFDAFHIITARSYPATMLSRSCNYFSKDIMEYMNKPDRVIILYDEDERISTQAATVFVQRGVDNVFLLSGGLKVLYKTFSTTMISGQVPYSYLPAQPRKKVHASANGSKTFQASHKHSLSSQDLEAVQLQLDEISLASIPSSRSSSRSAISSRSAVSSRSTVRTDSGNVSSRPWK